MLKDVTTALPNLPTGRFIPYIQIHEFEALLFSSSQALASALPGSPEVEIRKILSQVNHPEEINAGEATHPAERIEKLLPGYKKAKTIESIRIARIVGIQEMVTACPHFADWAGKLLDSVNI